MIEISKAVLLKDGKYLILKRAMTSKNYPGLWDFAGGKHDPGESAEESVVREVKEETNFDIEPGRELFKQNYKDDKHDLLFHYFKPVFRGEFKISQDHSEAKWLSLEEIEKLDLHPSVRIWLEKS